MIFGFRMPVEILILASMNISIHPKRRFGISRKFLSLYLICDRLNYDPFLPLRWDEMGRYDIPAVVQFILARNGKSETKLSYIGYSMGASMFFVAMIAHPELNSKIEVMIALGPAASLAHIASPVIRAVAPFAKYIEVCRQYLITNSPNLK